MTERGRYMTLAVIAVGALALAGCRYGTQPNREDNTYHLTEKVSHLVLTGHAGGIEVVAGDGPVEVHERLQYDDTKPTTSHRVDGDTLRLAAEDACRRCTVHYTIRVPAATSVDVTTEAGAITIRDITGDLSLKTDAGAIRGTGLGSAHTTAKTEAGALALAYTSVPTDVDGRSDAGAVDIKVPGGTTYAVDATTDAGHRTVDVQTSDAATHKIKAHTNAGAITVKTA